MPLVLASSQRHFYLFEYPSFIMNVKKKKNCKLSMKKIGQKKHVVKDGMQSGWKKGWHCWCIEPNWKSLPNIKGDTCSAADARITTCAKYTKWACCAKRTISPTRQLVFLCNESSDNRYTLLGNWATPNRDSERRGSISTMRPNARIARARPSAITRVSENDNNEDNDNLTTKQLWKWW